VRTLGVRFIKGICKDDTQGTFTLCRIIEACKERLPRTLIVEPGSWDERELLEIRRVAAQSQVVFELNDMGKCQLDLNIHWI
jgi:hypothetical protein